MLIDRMIRSRIVQEGKKCASKHHFDVFSWVTTFFYFFEACDSVHGMGIVAESYPALKRLYSLLKIEQAQLSLRNFLRKRLRTMLL